MYRSIFSLLEAWAKSKQRKPVVMLGARQVGKTFALKHLGQSRFENTLYINFEETPAAKSFFEKDLSPQRILSELSLHFGKSIEPGKSLLILDEIQEAPRALTSLKYFCEDMPAMHVAAAGSLLGLKLPKKASFPVGKVEFLHVFPMSFAEFLRACGDAALAERIEQIQPLGALPELLHERVNVRLRDYYFVGGMPEVVQDYVENNDFARARKIQKQILTSYQLDISKHATGTDIQKIFTIWESLPSQLARENKKFLYSHLGRGARSRDYENALQWLIDAGLVLRCGRINAGRLPLSAYVEDGAFKLFALDVGVLGAMANISPATLVQGEGVFTEFKGAFVENYVAQSLFCLGFQPYYWHSEGKAEVDFVIENEGKIVPVDAKAGVNVRSRSLGVFMEVNKVDVGVRMSLRNYERNGTLLNIPLYAAGNVFSLL